MLTVNTIIHATQAAVGLTNAAVNLGRTISDLHDRKSDLNIQTGTIQYKKGIDEAILNGHDPYKIVTGEDGKTTRRYVGFDEYKMKDGRTLGDLKQDVINTVGNNYWTNSGADRGMQIATNSFENIELDAQRQLAAKVMKDRSDVFNQQLTNAIEVFRITGDATQLDETIESATWMSADQKTATRLAAERQANLANINDTAMSIAQSQGMDAVKKYLSDQNIDKENEAKIFATAQHASTNSSTAAASSASNTFNQMKNGGASIGDAYRTAIENPSENPAVAEAQKKAAQNLQFNELSNRFGQELAGVDAMSLDQLGRLKSTYEARKNDYQDQGMLYKQHIDQIQKEIDSRKTINGSSTSMRTEAENVMANLYVQFNNKEISGPAAITSINQIRELSPEKAAQYEGKILNGGTNPAAEQTYLALDGIIRANTPGTKATAEEKMAYENDAQNLRQAIFQAYYNGVREENLTRLVEGYRKELASQVLQKAFKEGNIGNAGLFGSADNTATAFAFHSNQGNLDLRYSERTLNARNPYDTSPLTIGGENADKVMTQTAERNMQWANDELKNKGLQLTSFNLERDSTGDRDGRISYKGSDGKTYRVNATAENGSRFLERLENDRWVRVDFRDIPYIAPPRGTLNQNRNN